MEDAGEQVKDAEWLEEAAGTVIVGAAVPEDPAGVLVAVVEKEGIGEDNSCL